MPTGASLLATKGVPNVANWGRNASDALQGISADYRYHTLYGAHVKYVGLDIQIVNSGAVVATVSLDGVPYNVSAGSTKSITNHPFVELQVTAGTSLDIYIDGMLWDVGVELGYLIKENVCLWQ